MKRILPIAFLISLFFFPFIQVQANEFQNERFLIAADDKEGVPLRETLRNSNVTLPTNLPTFNLGDETSAVKALEGILLNYVIRPIFLLAGGVAVVVIMYSAGLIITGRGQEDAITKAKTTLVWAFVGLGLVILAYTIVSNVARIITENL